MVITKTRALGSDVKVDLMWNLQLVSEKIGYSRKRPRSSPSSKTLGRKGTSSDWLQRFLRVVSVDKRWVWLVNKKASKATINQSWETLVHRNDPGNRYAESLYPFPLQARCHYLSSWWMRPKFFVDCLLVLTFFTNKRNAFHFFHIQTLNLVSRCGINSKEKKVCAQSYRLLTNLQILVCRKPL